VTGVTEGPTWRRSSHSNGHSACVETATGCGQVHVRDSKNPDGGCLSFSQEDWAAFLATIRNG
jgi:Domain of unknown function (DUF397)